VLVLSSHVDTTVVVVILVKAGPDIDVSSVTDCPSSCVCLFPRSRGAGVVFAVTVLVLVYVLTGGVMGPL
jgi:hypothetical protein